MVKIEKMYKIFTQNLNSKNFFIAKIKYTINVLNITITVCPSFCISRTLKIKDANQRISGTIRKPHSIKKENISVLKIK